MATFKVIAVTPDYFTREIYVASERQVHIHDHNLKDKAVPPYVGYVLDPKDYPEGCRFILELKDTK